MNIKPILMNTDMVQAILAGRKTVTRRVVKDPYYIEDAEVSRVSGLAMHKGINITHGMPYPDSLYSPGDILYVRETWTTLLGRYLYRADQKPGMKSPAKWHPSIYMPREAARIWLRVTEVRVERLQEIENIASEGITMIPADNDRDPRFYFIQLWDSTIKPADREQYGWAANPWVWVIRFERCEKPD